MRGLVVGFCWVCGFFLNPTQIYQNMAKKIILSTAFFSLREVTMAEISQEQLASSDFHFSIGLGPKQSLIFHFLLELVNNHGVFFSAIIKLV